MTTVTVVTVGRGIESNSWLMQIQRVSQDRATLQTIYLDSKTLPEARTEADRVMVDLGMKPLAGWAMVDQRPFVPATFRAMQPQMAINYEPSKVYKTD